MKSSMYAAIFSLGLLLLAFFMMNDPFARAQTNPPQTFDGKVIIPSTYGDLVCLGQWDADASRCSGPQVSSGALTAITAMRTAEKLEQIRVLLTAINHQLAENPRPRQPAAGPTGAVSGSPSQAEVETVTDILVKEEVGPLMDLLEAGPLPTGPEVPVAGAE